MLELNSMRTITSIQPMAKEVFYHPQSSLLTRGSKRGAGGSPSLTVAIPFTFSTRWSRERSRVQDLEPPAPARPGSKAGQRSLKPESHPSPGRRSKTPSLPKLQQQTQQQRPPSQQLRHRVQRPLTSGKPSEAASKSTTTNSGSLTKKVGSGCEQNCLTSVPQEKVEVADVLPIPDRDDVVDTLPQEDIFQEEEAEEGYEEEEELSPEECEERRLNEAKCRRWLDGLPERFSGMHIVQQTLYTAHR